MAGMPGSTGPLIPRRRLGAEFRRLREARGEQLKDTAKKLMFSTSKLSRIETGVAEPQPRDLRDLLVYFGLTGTPHGADLERWAAEATEKPWWVVAGFDMPTRLEQYLAYESPATIIEEYSSNFIPGPLQTEDYATAVLRGLLPDLEPGEIAHQVALRRARRQYLDARSAPPQLVFAFPEEVLRRTVGSHAVMRAQITALLDETDERLALHVIPYSAGVYRALDASCTLFGYAAPDAPMVALSSAWTLEFTDGADVVATLRGRFDDLSDHWLDRAQTRAFLQEIHDSLPTS
ncbi:helix-turn-helix transcriptional regulator [Pseudonocardia ailaonensis]